MEDIKTVGSDSVDSYVNQFNDIQDMRYALQTFNKNDPQSIKKALQNITVLRIHHQLERIIRYTHMMDKIEQKMYDSIDATLDGMDDYNEQTWIKLASLQEKLQRSMIESHKLIEPYLNMEELTIVDQQQSEDPNSSFAAMILDQESREKLRTSAQQVLSIIDSQEGSNDK